MSSNSKTVQTLFFDFQSYRDIIKKFLNDNSETRGYQTRLAHIAGCQGSYLSQVLKGTAQLNLDQAMALCEYWQLEELETDYFLALVSYQRAGSERYRKKCMATIERLRHESKRFVNYINPEALPVVAMKPEHSSFFYSHWQCSAVRELLRIPGCRTISAIAERLSQPQPLIKKILEKLGEMQLVRQDGQEWLPFQEIIAEGDDSTLIKVYHRAMRDRANANLLQPEKIAMTFTCVDTIAKADIPLLTNALRETAKKQMRLSDAGAPEELVCLTMDFFVV